MVKHVILWKIKDEFSENEKVKIKQGIKDGLEGLSGKIPGLVEIKVNTNGLATSTADAQMRKFLNIKNPLRLISAIIVADFVTKYNPIQKKDTIRIHVP